MMGGRDNVLYPQLPLVKGDLLAAASGAAEARGPFRQAFESADAAGARMWQLRAATRLTELRSASGEPVGEERDALRIVFETFAGEPDTADLVDARAALEDGGS